MSKSSGDNNSIEPALRDIFAALSPYSIQDAINIFASEPAGIQEYEANGVISRKSLIDFLAQLRYEYADAMMRRRAVSGDG